MPPRAQIHDLNERGFIQWYYSVPLLTRSLLTVYLATGIALALRVLPPFYVIHSWRLVFKLPIPEVWRLITNFTIIGAPSIRYLFQLIWLVQYGAAYEAAKFGSNIADAITMLGVGMGSIMALDLVLPSIFGAAIHGPSLIFMLIYLWSKQNPNSMVSFFGLIQFQAVYLPFGLLAIEFVQGASPVTGILGILAGHVYYFLTDVYPRAYGRTLIQTPTWLARLAYRYGLGNVPRATVNAQHPSDVRFRAFSGRGQRLQ